MTSRPVDNDTVVYLLKKVKALEEQVNSLKNRKSTNLRFYDSAHFPVGAEGDVVIAQAVGEANAGIQFDTAPQEGNFLEATTVNDITLTSSSGGIYLADGDPIELFTSGTVNLIADLLVHLSSNTLIELLSGVGINLTAGGNINIQGADVSVRVSLGHSFTVKDSSGAPIFRVDEDGDLHGKSGKALTFDL
jgi:hypothetical protein